MQNEIQKEGDMNMVTTLTLKESFYIYFSMTFFAVVWVALMFFLPLPIVIGYFALLGATVTALWMSPRIVDAGVEDNGNFVKVK